MQTIREEAIKPNKGTHDTCVIVGSGSFAIHCALRLRAEGYVIRAVLACDQLFANWAKSENVQLLDSIPELDQFLSLTGVSWLFSIVNPQILPDSLLARVSAGAINYHDSPLPRYSGRHATSWAITAGEMQHGVTWHRMLGAVDAGDILVQRHFTVADDETALSLNLRCYQEAEQGFDILLSGLDTGELIASSQNPQDRMFSSRYRRPEAAGFFRWDRSAQNASRLVRAMTFGAGRVNPLTCAKIYHSRFAIGVGKLDVQAQRSGALPGTLLAIAANGWRISTDDEDVIVSKLAKVGSAEADPGALACELCVKVGDILPILSDAECNILRETHQVLAVWEEFWLERLERFTSPRLPFQRESDLHEDARMEASAWQGCATLDKVVPSARIDHLVGSLAIYLARVCMAPALQIGWDAGIRTPLLSPALVRLVPMELEIGLDLSFDEITAAIHAERKTLAEKGGYPLDLVNRYPQLGTNQSLRGARPWSVAISLTVGQEGDEQGDFGATDALGGCLTLQIRERDGAVRWIYDAAVLDIGQVERMTGHLFALASAGCNPEHKSLPVGRIDLLGVQERRLLLEDWNDTATAFAEDACIHDLFEAQVARSPDAIALICEDQEISYGELNVRANRVAHRLIELGVHPDARVGICVERSPLMIIGLLGVLKAGAAYVPLDPAYPADRLAFMLSDSAPVAVLVDAKTSGPVGAMLEEAGLPCPLLDLTAAEWAGGCDINPERSALGLTSRHLAYVIYTSGSTGKPKGVMIEHRSLVADVEDGVARYAISSSDRVLQLASFSFDTSAEQTFLSLWAGATLIVRANEIWGGDQLIENMRRFSVSIANLTPAYFAGTFVEDLNRLPALRLVLAGGEALPSKAFGSSRRHFKVFNLYGPTETTVTACAYPLEDGEATFRGPTVPIGRPMSNTHVYVVDAHGGLCPVGVPGELWIGGAGVARGYLNRPELTAERFIADPFSKVPDARIYRTGDLVRWRTDGNLEFLGRNDDQVKIRGYRIELGEIEAQLTAYPEVREAVVVAREDASGDKRLIAYVVPASQSARDVERESQTVAGWQEVYEEENKPESPAPFGDDFHGWNSSYDGQPIPLDEMEEWRTATVARILDLQPQRILEIGVGTGLLLSHLAPKCTEYWGIDFSQAIIDRLRDQIAVMPSLSSHTHVRCQEANVVDGLPAGSFDTVVINSVAQYFPTPQYLVDVIRQAMDLLGPEGAIFIGDIRSLPLHRCFSTAIELTNTKEKLPPASVRSAVERRLLLEKELLLDPRFFLALQDVISGISGVDIRIKRGLASNELSRYRYDAVIRKGAVQAYSAAQLPKVSWGNDVESSASIPAVAARHPNGFRLCNVPNVYLYKDLSLIADCGEPEVSNYINNIGLDPIHVESLVSLGEATGHRVVATWAHNSPYGELDVLFLPGNWSRLKDLYLPHPVTGEYADFANNPSKFETVGLAGVLRGHLSASLPDYMVPAAFVVLDGLPLTPNGKVDRRALPAPADEAYARGASEAPVGEIETMLADLWSELLGVERIGRGDNFFELGGHSLLAVRMISRIRREFGVEFRMARLFAQPVLLEMAEAISELVGSSGRQMLPAIRPVDRAGVLPLSFAQQRLWFLGQLDGVSASYHIPLALRLHGPLDRKALGHSLDRVWARHEGLRSVFVAKGGEPHVELLDADAGFNLVDHDLRGDEHALEHLAELCRAEAEAPFDLARTPLVRGRLIQLGDEAHVLVLTHHHIVSDGWSIKVFLRELETLYGAFARGREDPLPALDVQYPDYAVWQRQWLSGERQALQARYWGSDLADAPALLALPTDRARPPQQSSAGAHVAIRLDGELTRALRALSLRHGTTLFMTVLAAWAGVLSRLSGQDDIVIGTPVANRGRTETEGLIGFFVNTLALRIDLSGSPDVGALLSRVRSKVLAGQDHQDLPFEQVVEIVQPARRLDHTPLFQVMFSWQNEDVVASTTLDGLLVTPVEMDYEIAKFDLELALSEADDELVGSLGYSTALFDASTIERHAGYLEAMLRGFVADAASVIGRIDLLGVQERHLLLEDWNDTATAFAEDACIHDLFEAQVARSPDAIALICEDQEISYGELNVRANRVAHRLIELGVRPDARVGICVERSPLMIVGLLGVLKAGAAYVPLDPAYPADRLAFMLSDSAPVAVLVDAKTSGPVGAMLEEAGLPCPLLDLTTAEWASACDINPERSTLGLTSRHLAYVIYTSGSTGKPKGVMIEHRSLVADVEDGVARYAISSSDRVLQLASFSFDTSAEQTFLSLWAGATLIVRANEIWGGDQLIENMRRFSVSVSELPPAYFVGTFVQDLNRLPAFRLLIAGGEALPSKVFGSSRRHFKVLNSYGPTEAAVSACAYPLEDGEATYWGPTVPIGRPMSNTHVYVVDAYGGLCPVGVPGELWIGGAGVARGYLNRPELTAERFVADPFSKVPDARVYRTGDLVRWRTDGNLEFLGRNDDQVKIRGYRIELGEIEALLTAYPEVREAVVVAREDASGDKRLIAYVVMSDEIVGLAGVLRGHLSASLPDYMVPAAFVVLDGLPLTPNGKVDRRALPAPADEAYARGASEAPVGDIETMLADLWSELLGVERIGRGDNFFELGGHSLLAVRMVSRIGQLGHVVDVAALFESPRLHDLAARLGQKPKAVVPANTITKKSTAITPSMLPLADLTQAEIDYVVAQVPGGIVNVQDIYELSPLQDGMLFHHLLNEAGDTYIVVSQMAFASRALLDRYLEAAQHVVDRHDILRTSFVWDGLKSPVQVVWRHASLDVTFVDLDPTAGPALEQLKRRHDPRLYRMNLGQAPLMRFVIAPDTESERWLMLELSHHLIGDHSTQDVLNEEIEAILSGRQDDLPEPEPFRNLVAQARLGISQEEHGRFFRAMLGDVDEPTLPFGLGDVRRVGDSVDEARELLPQHLNNRLRTQARRLGVSLASLCHLAWGLVVARTSGREDVVFGTVLLGRTQGAAVLDRAMGLFINTLPFRLSVDETSVEAAVRKTHSLLTELLRHEHASLAQAQRCSGVHAPAPLFSALLNYRHQAPSTPGRAKALSGIEQLGGQELTNYPIAISVEDFGQSLGLTVQVVDGVSGSRLCAMMRQALESLADALVHHPTFSLRQLDVLPQAERHLLLEDWNDTATAFAEDACIHDLFEAQVARSPDAIALICEDQEISYGELNVRANRVAHRLIELGVRPDARVGICVERSPLMIVGLLGVLKAGAAYVPLDPAYPADRLAFMLSDSAPVAVLVDAKTFGPVGAMLEEAGLPCPLLDLNATEWASACDDNPERSALGLTSRHLAYVIYTSGSTGKPKGVMIEHQGVVNLTKAQIGLFGIDDRSRIMQFASFSFDACISEVATALCSGAVLYLPDHSVRLDYAQLENCIAEKAISHVTLPPALLHGQSSLESLATLQTIVLAGEASSASLIRSLPAGPVIINAYGPTEGTVCATGWICPIAFRGPTVPIGRPISNTHVYVVDAHGGLCPVGVPGELWIGGAGVARGYLNRPELTTERFIADPFSKVPDARVYRTGDLVRWRTDGNLEFLGRNDDQVKIRGYRIELGEIEAQLTAYPEVREAVVVAREDASGDKRLIAYVVMSDEIVGLAGVLRGHLSASLPDYMVPAAFVVLDGLPLTPNGKVDRRALPAPADEAYARGASEEPVGEIETMLADLWSELLGVERIGRGDNFFELGGHSLLAVRMISRIRREFGVEFRMARLFAQPVLLEMAEAISELVGSSGRQMLPAIRPVDRAGVLPLSFAQQRLWFLGQLDGVSASYHIPLALQLHGPLDRKALGHSLDRMWARHEGLRSVFVAKGGEPHVELLDADAGFNLVDHDLRDEDHVLEHLAELCRAEAEAPFDLARTPLVRGRLIQLGDEAHVLVLTHHHIVSDGWSIKVFLRELETLYGAFARGQEDPLPALDVQYPDYAVWQRQWLSGERQALQARYWGSDLADAPALLALPTDRARPPQQSSAGAHVAIRLDGELTRALRALSLRHGTTLFMTVLAAWAGVLSRLSGQDDIVIGTPVANRGRTETEGLIGFFVNTLALRIDLSGSPDVGALLSRVRSKVLAGQDHQDLPFEQVVEIVQPARRLDHTPLFQVMFSWQNEDVVASATLDGLSVTPVEMDYEVAKFDLELALSEADDELVGSLGYSTALFDASTIERHAGYLEAMLRGFVADAASVIGRIDLLGVQERHLLLEDWNDTATAFAEDACIHDLFEAQVARSTDAIALICEDQEISYGELNVRANRVAHRLIELGVRPDARVGICVERSPLMIVGLLGVLKAGAAYVPLDPAYPADRLAFMLSDSAPVAVLVDAKTFGPVGAMLEEAGLPCPLLDLNATEWASACDDNPERSALGLTSRHLAYVIYTSGSTGKPKGVMIEHAGVSNLLNALCSTYPLSAQDVVPAKTPFGFDASVRELYWPLICGARLVIARPEGHKDPAYLMELFRREQVTALYAVPSTIRALLEQGELHRCTSLRWMLSGAEPLSVQLVRRLREQLPALSIFSQYGPTETTVFVTHYPLAEIDSFEATVPIGRPMSNTHVYVVDAHGGLCLVGVAGELWIGGAGVARGYLNRPELTTERFIADPFSKVPDARVYRTGDLVRWRTDGNLEFLGRNDDQVKIRGYRIELGEIEAQLTAYPEVREAVVVAREDASGDKRLIAYVVMSDEIVGLAGVLRGHLSASLPDYMVPAAFVVLDGLPLTPNGKVDRRALPAPADEAYARGASEEPVGDIETMLADLWSELLGVERIGRGDNFFELGGHSLLAVRMVSRIHQKLGKVVTIQDILTQPKIDGIASLIQKEQIKPSPVRGLVQLSSTGSQRPLFIVHPSSGEVGAYPPLASAIGKDTPVFGLEAAGLHEDEMLKDTVEEIAEEYLSRMRQVQPTGPYRLAAWSLGGAIAYEMARQLRFANENVEFLGLIDCASNYKAPRYVSDVDDLLLRLPELIPTFKIGRLRAWKRGPRTIENLLAACQEAGYFDEGLTAQSVLRRTKVWRNLASAVERYVPSPSSLAIHLFLAKTPGDRKVIDGWRLLVAGRLTVEQIEGDHLSIMKIPLCNPLGASIAKALIFNDPKPAAAPSEHSGGTIAFVLFPEQSALNGSHNLARALKSAGHRIIYHGPSRYSSRVTAQGFEYRSLDMPLLQGERIGRRGIRGILDKWRAARLRMWHLLAQIRASDIRCETALLADKTDLVISDPLARIGVIPALKHKIPMVALNSTLASRQAKDIPPVFSSLLPADADTLGWKIRNSFAWGRCLWAAWRSQAVSAGLRTMMGLGKDRFWVEVRRWGGEIYWSEYGPRVSMPDLITTPRQFDFPRPQVDLSRTYLGNSIDLRRSDGGFHWDGFDAEKPLIYCSLGTYSDKYRHSKRLFTAVINALKSKDDIQAIVQIGAAAEISDFGELPSRIRVVKFAPQLEVLEKANVFITHAGHSSVMEALYFGVPMLTFPCWFDQFGNAARVQYHGVGVCGDIATVDETKIANMLEQLSPSEIKDAVLRMQKIFRAETKPLAGVELIEQMMKSAEP